MEYSIDSIITKNGDIIYFYMSIVNNKPWFRIVQVNQFSSFSFYDGDSLDNAKQIFCDLLLAFKGIKSMENFSRKDLNKEINNIYKNNATKKDLNYMQLKMDPLFLGMSDF